MRVIYDFTGNHKSDVAVNHAGDKCTLRSADYEDFFLLNGMIFAWNAEMLQ